MNKIVKAVITDYDEVIRLSTLILYIKIYNYDLFLPI